MDLGNEELKLTEVQSLLFELYEAIRVAHKIRRSNDNMIAKRIGIKPVTFNTYLNNSRVPSLENAIIIADAFKKYKGNDYRQKWLKVLGYPNMVIIDDDTLMSIVDKWSSLTNDAKKIIVEISQTPSSIHETN